MSVDQVVARTYRSDIRAAQARSTRRRVIEAAIRLFLERGWAGTTVRAVATAAGVSVPTVEQAFGTKATLLKAAIDVAIAGDDEAVPVLDRDWAAAVLRTPDLPARCALIAEVVGAAQARSARLVLAVYEGAQADPALSALATQMTRQRAATAAWCVDALAQVTPLRSPAHEAADSMWLLMDPAVYDRLVSSRGWSTQRYASWLATSIRHLLTPDHPPREDLL